MNDPAILNGRKTLTATEPSKVVLRFDAQPAIFQNGAWKGPRPRIVIYDSAFINDNVFSGDIVSADHLKNQYGLVIGTEGVQRVRRLIELDGENRDNNKAIAAAEAELTAIIRTIGAPAITLDSFLALEPRADIEVAVTAQKEKVQRVRRAKELKAAAEPSPFPVPTETDKLRELLNQSIDGIAEEALTSVRAHIAAHETGPHKGDTVHESWLESGMGFLRTDNCPFCGQRLTDRFLVNAYKDLFSEAYKTLGSSVKTTRDTFKRYRTGDFRAAVSRITEQNAVHFKYWREAGNLNSPDIDDITAIISAMEEAAASLDRIFAAKQANLIQALTGDEAEHALEKWNAGKVRLSAVNASIDAFLVSIRTLKDAVNIADLSRLENELKFLQAVKRRNDADTVGIVSTLSACRNKKDTIAREKEQVRDALNSYGRTITADLGTAINKYLQRLNAGFRIDYQEPDYRGKEPSASYNILINEVPVSPRSGLGVLDKPSFRNTLSAGDKSTLALALFLAMVNADPQLGDTIVVFDDPFTSLDHFRRQFTAIEIKKLCKRAHQTIVLSHEKNFLRLLWDKIDQNTTSSVALQTGAPGITTIAPYNIAEETQPRHITERMKIEEFVEGEGDHELNYIRSRLRTVSEDFYRKGDPALFGEAATLEEIIRRLEKAPEGHPYKGALEDLRDINEYSRGDSHAAVPGNPAEETSIEELKEFCRRVLVLTHGM